MSWIDLLAKMRRVPAASTLAGADKIPVVQSGVAKSATVGVLAGASGLTGEVRLYGGASAPSGWLACDGAAVSRTTYAALFAVIGTAHGVGDGSTTFNLPDLRGRVAVGAGTGSGLTARTLGSTGGSENMAFTATAASTDTPSSTSVLAKASFVLDPGDPENLTAVQVYDTGTGSANMQPFAVLAYIVKT